MYRLNMTAWLIIVNQILFSTKIRIRVKKNIDSSIELGIGITLNLGNAAAQVKVHLPCISLTSLRANPYWIWILGLLWLTHPFQHFNLLPKKVYVKATWYKRKWKDEPPRDQTETVGPFLLLTSTVQCWLTFPKLSLTY